MNEQDTDKGEVGSSSLPRPTNKFLANSFIKKLGGQ